MKKRSFVEENYKSAFDYLKKSKNFVYFIIFVFLFFVLFGAFVPVPEILEKKLIELIEELLMKTEGMSYLELTRFIFLNNSEVSFFGIFLGVFFGIFPFITTIVNGYLLGFIASKFIGFGNVLDLWRIFPHGIFELPAVFISMGLGLRLGISFIYRYFKHYFEKGNIFAVVLGIIFLVPSIVLTTIFNKKLRKKQFFDFKFRMLNSFKVFVLVVLPLLILAAIIEGSFIFLLKG